MSDEIKISYETGSDLYVRVYNDAGLLWNGSAFEAWVAANVLTYGTDLTDGESNEYLGDFPVLTAGTYGVIAFNQSGSSYSTTDTAVSPIGVIIWDGTAEVPQASQDDVTDAHATTDALIAAISSSVLAILNIYDESGDATLGGTYPVIETDGGGVYP